MVDFKSKQKDNDQKLIQSRPTSTLNIKRERRTHTKFDKRQRKTHTVNRLNSSFPTGGHSATLIENGSKIYFYLLTLIINFDRVGRKTLRN